MKVHSNLKEMLLDYVATCNIVHYKVGIQDIEKFTDEYLSNNIIALGKPEPLAKNKQCDDDFFCEWSVAHDMDNQKCDAQCIYCKSH